MSEKVKPTEEELKEYGKLVFKSLNQIIQLARKVGDVRTAILFSGIFTIITDKDISNLRALEKEVAKTVLMSAIKDPEFLLHMKKNVKDFEDKSFEDTFGQLTSSINESTDFISNS